MEPQPENEAATGLSGAERRREYTKKTLIIYALLMAAFVIVLLAISYIGQVKADREIDETLAQLDISRDYAAGVERNIALIRDENVVLKKELAAVSARRAELETRTDTSEANIERLNVEIEERTKEITRLEAAVLESERIAKSCSYYADLLDEYGQRDYASCREIIGEMEADSMVSRLSQEQLERYMEISKRID